MFGLDKLFGKKKKNKNNNYLQNFGMDDNFNTNNVVNNILGNKSKKSKSFNGFSNIPNKILRNNKGNDASLKKQRQWKKFNRKQRNKRRRKYKDSDGDRIPNRWDCSPHNTMRQDDGSVIKNFVADDGTKINLENKNPKQLYSQLKKHDSLFMVDDFSYFSDKDKMSNKALNNLQHVRRLKENEDLRKDAQNKLESLKKSSDTNPSKRRKIKDRFKTVKEENPELLSKNEEDFIKYYLLQNKDGSGEKLTNSEKRFLKEYRAKNNLYQDIFNFESEDKLDNDENYRQWKSGRM